MRWIKLYDSLLNWRWAHKPEYMAFVVHCLLRSNPSAKKWENLELKRGSFICGREDFAKEVGISVQTYRTILKNLQECEFLTAKSTNKGTIITICNYDSYQEMKKQSNQQLTTVSPTGNQQLTTVSPTGNQQLTTIIDNKNKRITELKNKEKNINTHTEILKNFQNVCKNNTLAERLTSEFIAFNAEKNQEWWDNGLWKNHVQGFYRRDLKLKGQKTQSPQIAPVPPTVQKQAPQAPDPEAVKVWENVKKRLSELMNAKAIKVWINPITAFAVNGKELTIEVPSQFFYEYLEKNYLPQLKTALSEEKIEILKYIIIA